MNLLRSHVKRTPSLPIAGQSVEHRQKRMGNEPYSQRSLDLGWADLPHFTRHVGNDRPEGLRFGVNPLHGISGHREEHGHQKSGEPSPSQGSGYPVRWNM